MFRILLFAAAPLLVSASVDGMPPGQKPSQTMMEPLSADLIPEIFGQDAFLLVEISKAGLSVLPGAEPAVEAGTLTLRVVDTLRKGPAPVAGTIEVPAHRIVDPTRRLKSNQDQWNNLTLAPGSSLIVACRPTNPPTEWVATAAVQVSGPDDPEVAAVGRALAIEGSPPEQRGGLLREALVDGSEFLRFYAMNALKSGSVVPKSTGAEYIAEAIRSEALTPIDRLELGRGLTDFFHPSSNADGSNPIVLAGLCEGLLSESDLQRKLEWARLIYSCFMVEFDSDPGRNETIRKDLEGKLSDSLVSRTGEVLSALSHDNLSSGDRETISQLVEAWQR